LTHSEEVGYVLSRGDKKIPIEREESYFTAYLKDKEEFEKITKIVGVDYVKPILPQVFKIRVDPEIRDKIMSNMRSKEMNIICHHSYKPKVTTNTRYYITDKIIACFKPETPSEKIQEIISKNGVQIIKQYRDEKNCFLLQVKSIANKNPVKVANLLERHNELIYAQNNLINRNQLFYRPSDTLFNNQWHLDSWDAPFMVNNADVSAPEAWDIVKGKREVVVACLDDGFDLSHPDFNVEDKIVQPKDYVDGDSNPFPTAAAKDYHGTPVAGVAIAEENGTGVVGGSSRMFVYAC